MTVYRFAGDLKTIFGGVMVCGVMSADRPNQDRSRRPVTTATDAVSIGEHLSVCESLGKYSKQCYGVG